MYCDFSAGEGGGCNSCGFVVFQFELKERQRRQEQEYLAEHPDATISGRPSLVQKYIEEFLPPPEPEP